MFRSLVTFRGRLAAYAKPDDNTLELYNGAAKELDAIGAGNYTYLMLTGPNRREVVKYTHSLNYDEKQFPDTIHVERGIEGGQQAFGAGDCVQFVWTSEGILALKSEAE